MVRQSVSVASSSGFQTGEMWRPQSKFIVRCSLLICVVSRVLLFQNHELTFVLWLMTFVTFVCVYITALLSIHICQGMLGIPPNCERDSCLAYAQWTQVDSATVQFELEATSPGWVAVGVSADQVMGTNGIDDVFACQRDATNDTACVCRGHVQPARPITKKEYS